MTARSKHIAVHYHFSMTKLNMHLRSGTHSRKAQLLRNIEFKVKAQNRGEMIACPICQLVPADCKGKTATFKMMAYMKPLKNGQQLWELLVDAFKNSNERHENGQYLGRGLLKIIK